MKIRLIGTTLAAAAALGVAGAAADEITMATWGGAFGKAFQKHWTGPFEAATGTKVNLIFGGSLTNKQKVAAEKDDPKIDVLTMVTGDAIDAYRRDLTVALDPARLANLSQLRDLAIKKGEDGGILGAGLWVTAFGVAYRTDKVDFELETWNDLADPRPPEQGRAAVAEILQRPFRVVVEPPSPAASPRTFPPASTGSRGSART